MASSMIAIVCACWARSAGSDASLESDLAGIASSGSKSSSAVSPRPSAESTVVHVERTPFDGGEKRRNFLSGGQLTRFLSDIRDDYRVRRLGARQSRPPATCIV